MALPSGNFSSVNSGQLIVNFAGLYTATNGDFSSTAGSDIRVLCQILNSSGTVVGAGLMSRITGAQVTLFVDYPGSSAVWSLACSEIDYRINGAGSVNVAVAVKVRLAKL